MSEVCGWLLNLEFALFGLYGIVGIAFCSKLKLTGPLDFACAIGVVVSPSESKHHDKLSLILLGFVCLLLVLRILGMLREIREKSEVAGCRLGSDTSDAV